MIRYSLSAALILAIQLKTERKVADLVLMGVPVLALFGRQGFKNTARDNVLDPDQTGVRLVAVVDDALSHLTRHMAAEVMGDHLEQSKAMMFKPYRCLASLA